MRIAIAAMLLASGCAWAHQHGEQWALANEYPASSIAGEGDEQFAKLVADETQGGLSIVTMPDAKLGYKSREQLKAVGDGRVPMADTLGGALVDAEPIFALSSLPFLAANLAEARALYDSARPAYEAAFERHNQKLLYATPWPPSGLWARGPANTPEAVAKLKLRTYDKTGTDIFTHLGAKASVVSFSDLAARLASGEIDAVLSSGDGGAARKLWDHMSHFTEINYAIPLSFTTVNLDRWNSLDDAARAAVLRAAKQTEARQWSAPEARIASNYEALRAHGMTIVQSVSPELGARFREEGRKAASEWAERAGPEARAILGPR